MIVNPTNASIPLIAPSVNIQTEQAARDNKVREPIPQTVELTKSAAEKRATIEEKRRKRGAWNPADHPEYDVEEEAEASELATDPLERIFQLLALNTYSHTQGLGYTIRFKLPKKVLDDALSAGKMAQRRTIIKYHYGHSVAPHNPSEVIAIT
ncbi:ATP-dependent Lon protease [Vibrio sp. SCSIO 43136]|uniref:ATP-dependent Lon protease n=1 Tax=Vibrio sp. SCSIO 43136 TaxID=2819101 RepID=UPI002075AA96|nr:ATP-dependent Lon protease [Vibrio sp. SCSIO 43136]USD65173.1 ATP-dependent Lon protease [Vibrio sp. SCSIO 43136]